VYHIESEIDKRLCRWTLIS